MAQITITISDVKDSSIIDWLEKLRPLKNSITIEHAEESKELKKFWERYEKYISKINHSIDPALIAVNTGHFREIVMKEEKTFPSHNFLTRLFNENIGNGCLGHKTVRSKLFNKVIHCWIFKHPSRIGRCE